MAVQEPMKAVIPVAGEGTRLRPHTYAWPKCLIHVGGKPIVDHILELIEPVGITEAILIVGYKGERVREHLEREYKGGVHCTCVEQAQPLGLGHAILQAAPHVGDTPMLIIYGDTLFEADLASAVRLGVSAIGTKEIAHPDAFGVVFSDAHGRIERVVEKPKGLERGQIIVGVNIIRESALLFSHLERRRVNGLVGAKGEYQVTDAFQDMISEGVEFRTFPVHAWYDCGNRDALLATNRHVLEAKGKGLASPVAEETVLIPPVRIAPGARVRRSVLGPNVTVGEGAEIEHAVLMDTIVNPKATVKRAVLRRSIVGHAAVVEGPVQRVDVGDSATLMFCGTEDEV